MTAISAYYDAIERGHLPSVIRIADDEGDEGIATGTLAIIPGSEASELVFSGDPQDRALAALHAIACSQLEIERSFRDSGIKILT